MPLAATHRNFKRNASSATGASHNSVHTSHRGRGGVGRSGAEWGGAGRSGAERGMQRSGSASWNTVVSVRPPWFP